MLTYEDCLALCDFTAEEIDAIAEHEHIDQMLAVELGQYLLQTDDGELRVRRMILEDIEMHRIRGDAAGVERLEMVLKYFLANHPRARRAAAKAGTG